MKRSLTSLTSCLICLLSYSASYAATSEFCLSQLSETRYIDNNNGTVYDNYTGLTWQRCNLGQQWDKTLNICSSSSVEITDDWRTQLQRLDDYNSTEAAAGRNFDWRMPNLKELSSITELQCYNLSIDTATFIDPKTVYWTSSPYSKAISSITSIDGTDIDDENLIWTLNFITGKDFWQPASFRAAVLLVRGQSTK